VVLAYIEVFEGVSLFGRLPIQDRINVILGGMEEGGEIKLNKAQKEATQHVRGPVLIVAGAGTGKTRVITERIKYLINNNLAKPKEILALTFTEKGAEEMLNRVDEIMPIGYEEPWITTFHSFAERILREEALEIGLDPQYKILTSSDSWVLFRKNLFNFGLNYFLPLGNPSKFVDAILTFFSRLQDEDVMPLDFEKWARKDSGGEERYLELSNAYKMYQEIKIKGSSLDFGDLITWCLKLFRRRPKILEKYKNQFKYIMLDEFQDTNFAQFQLIKLLAPASEDPNLMVVGDDSQSIYKFRGAAVSNILDFIDEYPNAKQMYLLENYRSTQKILDAAYTLIRNNDPDTLEYKLKINKDLKSTRVGESPKILAVDTAEEEADAVCNKIVELLGTNSLCTYKDFAILARANNHLDAFVSALKRYGMPYQVIGSRGLFSQDEVLNLISFLRICVDTSDSVSLYGLLKSDMFSYEHSLVLKALNYAKEKKITLWDALYEDSSFAGFVSLMENSIEESGKSPVSVVLYNFILKASPKFLSEAESIEKELKIKNIGLFFDYVKRYEATQKDSTVWGFVGYLDMMLESGENPAQAVIEDIDTVNLLTVHASKGLEFPVVFLVNLVSDRFPTRRRRDAIEVPENLVKETLPLGDYHIQEERRLFYVGMTRAKDLLYLTHARNYGGLKGKRPSPFIGELGSIDEEKKAEQLNLFLSLPSKIPAKSVGERATPPFVSYSQLDVYRTCPLKYKYRYVLNVPIKLNHALSFGQTIHNTLRDFHKWKIRSLGGSEKEDPVRKILEIYEKSFIPLGYDNKEHRDARFKKGEEMLVKYIESAKNFGEPKFLEQKFKLRSFKVPLVGFIDRIDLVDSGYEIIDYKTGSVKDQARIDKDSQLSIYALAALEELKIEPKKLSFYFIEEDTRIDTVRTVEDLDAEREAIKETIKEIEGGGFTAKPGLYCKYCDFNKICPYYKNYLSY